MNKVILCCLLFVFLVYNVIGARVPCTKECCHGKERQEKQQEEAEECKIRCYAGIASRSKRNVGHPYIGGYSPYSVSGGDSYSDRGAPSPKQDTTTKKRKSGKKGKKENPEDAYKRISECVSKCPKVSQQSWSCNDQCCNERKKLQDNRHGKVTYQCHNNCCNGRFIDILDLMIILTLEIVLRHHKTALEMEGI